MSYKRKYKRNKKSVLELKKRRRSELRQRQRQRRKESGQKKNLKDRKN